jgi:hypothetical protein
VEPRGLEPLTPCLQSRSGAIGEPPLREAAHASLVAQAVIIAGAAAVCCCTPIELTAALSVRSVVRAGAPACAFARSGRPRGPCTVLHLVAALRKSVSPSRPLVAPA